MPTDEKRQAVAELADLIRNSSAMAVADYRGLKVSEMQTVRRSLRDAGVQLHIAKNRLLKIAADEAGTEELKPMLSGPTALATIDDDEVALAKAHGCHHVINYNSEDFVARVRELTDGRGVDVVYDGVGKETFEKSLDCLRPRGLMVSFGNASGVVSIPDLTILARKGSLYVTRPTTASYFARSSIVIRPPPRFISSAIAFAVSPL